MEAEKNPKRIAGVLLVLLYTFWLSAFWGLLAFRINAPPDERLPFAILLAYLTLLFFAYPLLQATTAIYYADRERGFGSSLLPALRRALPRYPQVLLGFAMLLGAFFAVSLPLYGWLGSDLESFFFERERRLGKVEIFAEAFGVGVAVSALAAALPPIPYPIGLIVALKPSGESLFSSSTTTLIAAGLVFLPMMRYVFLLPIVSVYGVTVREGFRILHAHPFRVWASQGGVLLATAKGLWIVLVFGFILGGYSFPLYELWPRLRWGRWVLPVVNAGAAFVVLGPVPGLISVAFQRGRARALSRVLELRAAADQ